MPVAPLPMTHASRALFVTEPGGARAGLSGPQRYRGGDLTPCLQEEL